MIDVNALLDDKDTWKICEAVHLGFSTIFLSFYKEENAESEFSKGYFEGLFRRYERWNGTTYKFYLTDSVIQDYKKNVMPFLKKNWWGEKKSWMM